MLSLLFSHHSDGSFIMLKGIVTPLSISLENIQTPEDVMTNTHETEDIINHIDYKSPTSNYGLIHEVLKTNHRESRKFQSGWRSNDVWLDDGDLLVLKDGILNNNNKKHVKRKIFKSPVFEKVNNNIWIPLAH